MAQKALEDKQIGSMVEHWNWAIALHKLNS
jgi:hypothetical protein